MARRLSSLKPCQGRRKLNAARRFARNIKSIGSQREVYDSGKDIVDSMEERERKEMEEFDRKFKG